MIDGLLILTMVFLVSFDFSDVFRVKSVLCLVYLHSPYSLFYFEIPFTLTWICFLCLNCSPPLVDLWVCVYIMSCLFFSLTVCLMVLQVRSPSCVPHLLLWQHFFFCTLASFVSCTSFQFLTNPDIFFWLIALPFTGCNKILSTSKYCLIFLKLVSKKACQWRTVTLPCLNMTRLLPWHTCCTFWCASLYLMRFSSQLSSPSSASPQSLCSQSSKVKPTNWDSCRTTPSRFSISKWGSKLYAPSDLLPDSPVSAWPDAVVSQEVCYNTQRTPNSTLFFQHRSTSKVPWDFQIFRALTWPSVSHECRIWTTQLKWPNSIFFPPVQHKPVDV